MDTLEQRLRGQLETLAADDRGRALLQLSLRGIHAGEQTLTAGCWTDHGVAGCLFQHAYWQGVREGVFEDRGRPGDWIGSLVGSGLYGDVIGAIDSFDRLAKTRYADREQRWVGPDRIHIRQAEWQEAVEAMLVDVLAQTAPARVPAALATREGR
ncbi:MAG: hypothetical protein ACTHNU_16830 [Gaiellales bacterium]